MLLRKAEEQEKEDRENPENRTKPKPAPEKEAPEEGSPSARQKLLRFHQLGKHPPVAGSR